MGTASANTVIDQSNFRSTNFDYSKIFIWDNRYETATFKNNSGGAAAFEPGTLLARDSSDNTIVPLLAATTANGANIPIGVLHQPVASLANAATLTNISFCTGGDVARDKFIFQAANAFTTVPTGETRTIEDLLLSQNIRAIETEELSGFDNQ